VSDDQGPSAAERIQALEAELAETKRDREEWFKKCEWALERLKQAETRVGTTRIVMAKLLAERGCLGCKEGAPWPKGENPRLLAEHHQGGCLSLLAIPIVEGKAL
jgi:hypothetical protein